MPKNQNLEVHLSPPMSLAQITAKSSMTVDEITLAMVTLAMAGLLRLTDEDRGLYRVCFTTRGSTHG